MKKKFIPIVIIISILVIVSVVLFLIYTFSGNYISYGAVDTTAESATLSDAKDANIIIVNGIVVGGNKDGRWINADKMYEINKNLESIEVNMFSENKMYGVYNTASLKKYKSDVIYTTLAKDNLPSSYLAQSSNASTNMPGMTKLDAESEDENYVKEALGSYKIINNTVKITESYFTNIKFNSDKIICAVSAKKSIFGAYSAVVYVNNKKATLVKYTYVKDTNNANRFPVYSLKYVKDLNEDDVPEIVLEEVTGNDVSYSVLELRQNKFYQVLNASVEI